MAAELQIGDRRYLIGKMGVREQLHVLRRMGKLTNSVFVAMRMARQGIKVDPTSVMLSTTEELATMSDESINYIIDRCFEVVSVLGPQADTPMPMVVNGQVMFGDLGVMPTLAIVREVLEEHFHPFLAGLLAGQSNDEPPPPATS